MEGSRAVHPNPGPTAVVPSGPSFTPFRVSGPQRMPHRAPFSSQSTISPVPMVFRAQSQGHGQGQTEGQGQPSGSKQSKKKGFERRQESKFNHRSNRRTESIVDDVPKNLKVQVMGFPPFTTSADLVRTFAGSARVDFILPRQAYATVVFNTVDDAKAAVQKNNKANIYGSFLQVRPYTGKGCEPQTNRPTFVRSKQKASIIEPKDIDLSGEVMEQIGRVLNAVRLTQEEATAVAAIYSDVQAALQDCWPGCVALPFGSITTGLGIKSSDADCFLQMSNGRFPRGDIAVMMAKRFLQGYPNLFTEILCIPQANTPIVKFFHLPTQTNCDLSFKTPLGVRNSKLIAFLLQSDPRLVPMAVIIKYWAKVHQLSGTGKLTNYALTMMVIFYLQQAPMSILPAVEWLQRDSADDVMVDHWNTGFMGNKDLLPPCTNTSSLTELLGGFFEFYSTFDFEKYIVCPLLGRPIEKSLFKDLNCLPEEFEFYKHNVLNNLTPPLKFLSAMCIQDPFELSHNVASMISVRLASDIIAYIKFAADAYENDKQNSCREFLKNILLNKPKLPKTKPDPEFSIKLMPRLLRKIIEPDWNSVLRNIVHDVFENWLKVKLTKLEDRPETNNRKSRIRYSGALTKPIWRRRKYMKRYQNMKMDLREKQIKITEDILSYEQEVVDCQFLLSISCNNQTRVAVFTVKFKEGNVAAFREFGSLYCSSVQHWVSSSLKPCIKALEPETPDSIAETIKMLDSLGQDSDDETSDEDSLPNEDSTDQKKVFHNNALTNSVT